MLNRFEDTAKLFAIVMLFGALGRHRYDYFTLLRWVVCGVSAFAAFRAGVLYKMMWVLPLAVVALAFNPFAPLRFIRETWLIIDVGRAVLLIASVVFYCRHGSEKAGERAAPGVLGRSVIPSLAR